MILFKKGDDITPFDGTRILIKSLDTVAQPVVKLKQNQQIFFT
jgi:hypothetical protein